MSGTASDQLLEEARASYEAGDFGTARELALTALAERPDDLGLLRLAGRASFELGLDEAVSHLERATSLDPEDAETWNDLAVALVNEGKLGEAAVAFRNAVRLRPDEARALVDLGHTAYASGQTEEAIQALRQAVEQEPGNVGALTGLISIYRREGRLEEALDAARELSRLEPDDVLASLDVAELSLELDRLDEAREAFGRLRSLDDDPEHEVYAFHGMIETELRRDRWRRALDLAVDATRVDRLGRTTDLLAFIVSKVFGAADRPAPSRAEVESALRASRVEHRRLHEESVVL
jgi:Flp pilus assembly protein TadD